MTTYAFPRHGSAIPHLMGNPWGFLFILLFGEKNEPRRTAARYRAFSLGRRRLARGLRNSLRSHSPRPLSALGCRPPGPIRAVSPFPYLRVFACFPFIFLLPFRLKGEGSVIPRMTGIPQNNPLRATGFPLCGGNGGMCPQRQNTVKWQKKRGGNDRKGVVRLSKKGLFRSRAYRSPGGLCPPFLRGSEK